MNFKQSINRSRRSFLTRFFAQSVPVVSISLPAQAIFLNPRRTPHHMWAFLWKRYYGNVIKDTLKSLNWQHDTKCRPLCLVVDIVKFPYNSYKVRYRPNVVFFLDLRKSLGQVERYTNDGNRLGKKTGLKTTVLTDFWTV